MEMTVEEKIGLTESQKMAVESTDSPLLIVAGPGTGKTRVLTEKAFYLIDKLNIDPSRMMMTTFTVKASEEMRQRLVSRTSRDVSGMFIGTIHSFCEGVLKECGGGEKYADFDILDDFRRYMFLKKNLKRLGLDLGELRKIKGVKHNNELILLLSGFYDTLTENQVNLDKLKQELLAEGGDELIKRLTDQHKKKGQEVSEEELRQIIHLALDSYPLYMELLSEHKYLDFANLEAFAWQILANDAGILAELQNKYDYILIDEFQDINPLQWKILSAVAAPKNNICCVGDRNQSIYGFRGSNPNIFDSFSKQYPDARSINLDINFRSRKEIVGLSDFFLKKRGRTHINLKNNRAECCEVYHISAENETEEARSILNLIKELKLNGKISDYGDVAILFRSLKYHGAKLRGLLDKEYTEIPYVLYGGMSFLRNPEVEEILYLMAYVFGLEEENETPKVTGYSDFSELFERGSLECGCDLESLRELNWSLFDDPKVLAEKGISQNSARKIVELNHLRARIAERGEQSIQDVFYEIMGIFDVIGLEQDAARKKSLYILGNISKLLEDFVFVYGNGDFLMFLRLLSAFPENLNINKKADGFEVLDNHSLYLMNIHQAKGLEFPVVIVPSLTKRRIPKSKLPSELINIPEKFYLYEKYSPLKEEENLFYVAITRARDALFLTHFDAYDSGKTSNPSEFISDFDGHISDFSEDRLANVEISPKPEEKPGIKLVDFSAISTFVDCPERFKINYVYGFKAEEIFQQKVGRIYHNALAKLNVDMGRGSCVDGQRLEAILDESWVDLGKNNEIFRHKIRRSLDRYNDFMGKELGHVISIESPVSVMMEGIRIRGRTDFLFENKAGEVVLMDFKARKLKAISETHVDLQLKFYANALRKDGQKVDRAVAYPIEEEKFRLSDAEFPVEDGSEAKRVLNEFSEAVIGEKYCGTGKGKLFCKNCPYRFMCKHFKRAI